MYELIKKPMIERINRPITTTSNPRGIVIIKVVMIKGNRIKLIFKNKSDRPIAFNKLTFNKLIGVKILIKQNHLTNTTAGIHFSVRK